MEGLIAPGEEAITVGAAVLLGFCFGLGLLAVLPADHPLFSLLRPAGAERVKDGGMGKARPTVLKRSTTKHLCPAVSADTVQELIEARRSIFPKDYTGALVDDSAVRKLLDAARWAPTHGKTEPWRFVCFAPSARQHLLDATLAHYSRKDPSFWTSAWGGEFPTFANFEDYFRKQSKAKWMMCSHLIAVGMRRQRPGEGKKTYPEHEELASVACAVQNMHILATSMRLGAYWSSWFDHFVESSEGVRFLGLDPSAGDRWIGVFVIGSAEAHKIDSYRATRKAVTETSEWREV
mmetsp:Transcript_20576/g.55455  ORF Transcript_20576/g.55455 Transcript_20576/m.55455 type:complete len:292 (-) Transcript_20576:364-1239(-)